MNHRRRTILAPFVAIIMAIAGISPSIADGDIIVAAHETEAEVRPRAAHLRLINLPALDFSLRAAIRCKGTPVSLTMSVADTLTTLGAEDLEGQRSTEAVLTVPAAQLALAASSRFCIRDDDETENELLVPGLATAHASLRCASEQGESVHYSSAPLQVRLTCQRESGAAQEPPSDQSDNR